MGWARTLLLGDIGNRLDIADAERDIQRIRQEFRNVRLVNASQDTAIQELQKENEQLEICVAALIQTMEKKGVLTRDEVKNLVELIED